MNLYNRIFPENVSCGNCLKSFFIKYFMIKGRTRRIEFWCSAFILYMLFIFPWTIFIVTKTIIYQDKEINEGLYYGLLITCILLSIFFWIPIITAGVRRLHDTNKSGCFWFLIFAPAGIFVLLYFFLKDSDIGDNQYGPSPKYPALINPNNMQPNYIPQMSISQPQFINQPLQQPMMYPQSNQEPFMNQQYPQPNNNTSGNDDDGNENLFAAHEIKPGGL